MEKIIRSTKSSPQNAKKFFYPSHTDNTQIKVTDWSSFRNKLYSTFVADSMSSNLVHISDRHKIESAPYESV